MNKRKEKYLDGKKMNEMSERKRDGLYSADGRMTKRDDKMFETKQNELKGRKEENF